MANPLGLYESLDVIGTGSFGIIRKVRRRSDGLVFARKELNFERMSERDRKQIVAEVNILKDLHHEHIVRYHDRHVDRDAGILYILMEYCGGGDLSTVIKQAQRQGRTIPEDTVWNYFMQILLALNHCHHPNGQGRSGSDVDNKEKRAQVLHRDLKPDNVFLDENNCVKLGDFGLSKSLPQASFANTYVGTPYYMSPELMQERAYDTKSDIWSLGCLIFELCALKPPFHEAKTHAELSILIRNGRIPPLPKGYSPALSSVIKAMLNLNPAMRPSAAQLLGHERLELAFKVSETQKLLTAVKAHKTTLLAKERDVSAREAALAVKQSALQTALSQKDAEIATLRTQAAALEATTETRIREALMRREEELRAHVLRQEADVAARIARREEEIMEAVRQREEEIGRMWAQWEAETRAGMAQAVEERMSWVQARSDEIDAERARLEEAKEELERKVAALEAGAGWKAPRGKAPLEEVKNILQAERPNPSNRTPMRAPIATPNPDFKTPMNRPVSKPVALPAPNFAMSAMRGVVLTDTGEPVATPTPAELARMFIETPGIALQYTKSFDKPEPESDGESDESTYEPDTPVPSRRSSSGTSTDTRRTSRRSSTGTSSSEAATVPPAPAPVPAPTPTPEPAPEPAVRRSSLDTDRDQDNETTPQPAPAVRPTRLRRPSIRAGAKPPNLDALEPEPEPARAPPRKAPRAPCAGPSASAPPRAAVPAASAPAPEYDLSDEENLPSPFLRRLDRERLVRTTSAGPVPTRTAPRKSGGLRTVAVMNNARGAAPAPAPARKASLKPGDAPRSAIQKAQKAEVEARKVLGRPRS